MQALICSIGTEILLGNITDTNSRYIAEGLKNLGIDVYKMITIGDNEKRLYDALIEADGKYDYVITSGGLGPTSDDITKETVIKVCDKEDQTIIDEKSLAKLKDYFNDENKAMMVNKKQAMFPKDAIILDNPIGTAPGCIIESKNKTKYILMPGPPNEMVRMFDNEVREHLGKQAIIKSVNAKIALLGEWDMASRIDLSESSPTISPYITDEGPILRITAKATNEDEASRIVKEGIEKVERAFGKYVITCEDKKKEEVLKDILVSRNEYVATAESITGGLIASKIIDIPGASDILKESYVVYSDEAKHKILNVSHETIKTYDVVSKEVVSEMIDGLYDISKANLCLATSGYAHTGVVYLGILYNGRKIIKKKEFKGDRNRVRLRSEFTMMDLAIMIMRGVDEDNISF